MAGARGEEETVWKRVNLAWRCSDGRSEDGSLHLLPRRVSQRRHNLAVLQLHGADAIWRTVAVHDVMIAAMQQMQQMQQMQEMMQQMQEMMQQMQGSRRLMTATDITWRERRSAAR
jgi:ABC-type lipopolysaccharide export system ATPase subunit